MNLLYMEYTYLKLIEISDGTTKKNKLDNDVHVAFYFLKPGTTSTPTWHTGNQQDWGWSTYSPEVTAPSGESVVQFWSREENIKVRCRVHLHGSGCQKADVIILKSKFWMSDFHRSQVFFQHMGQELEIHPGCSGLQVPDPVTFHTQPNCGL